ncbi:hypothetical protein F2Q70_00035855 [Brassica cretica]|uniref:F-box associated beta-propeller type 3 domain-containing protein n=1 Tax=Brassica cretica TaxID=69181 RepID=A0A8S9JW75_BRACR|nr:hypothetical protein F2Q70_00035855 [Brassica cretica]
MLVFVRGVGAVCVYDHPGDEATLVKQMVSDRTLPEYHIDLISESSGVALLEPSRSIRRFLRFLQNPWKRDVWTSDAALVGGGSETFGLATHIVWGVGAETFAFYAALEGRGTETDCTSDAAYASCLFMLELNFHSGSSITQVNMTTSWICGRIGVLGSLYFISHTVLERGGDGCYNLVSERGSVPALTRDGDLLGRGFDSVCISFVSRVQRLSACGCVTLLPPPKLQAISPRVFVIGDYVFAFTTTLEMNLLWLSKWCPIGVNLVSMDRGHIVLHYDRRDLKFNESSGVALLEPSRSIRRFLRFLQNPWQRDVWTSDAALVGGGSETSGLATQIVWGVGAETFAFDAALEGGGIETYCTSDAAYESCLFMLELNFYSGSSITQMRLARRSDCYRAGVTLCLPDIFFFARKSIWGSDMGEIFWAPKRWTYPFYVFYYNVERQSVRRVEIKGIEEKVLMGRDRLERVFTFTNHVENLMFLQ